MNEVDLIQTQLFAERRHAAEVANACVAALESSSLRDPALDEFCQACVEYLVWVLTRFEERDQMLAELFHSRLAGGDEIRRTLDELIALPGRSRDALAKLEAALASNTQRESADTRGKRWHEFGHFFNGAWSARRDALDRLLERHSRVADWRAVSAIDADSILDERNRYSRVKAKVPVGVELQAPAAAAPAR